jgi:hypothetical protein
MNDTDLDQVDEDILTYTVSDEALEAAAGTERGAPRACPQLSKMKAAAKWIPARKFLAVLS